MAEVRRGDRRSTTQLCDVQSRSGMTKGLAFLVGMLIEGAVSALLAMLLRKQLDLPRFSAAVRCGAAAVSEAGVVLVEMLFYAAALRGHWRWSLALSIVVNAAAFSAGMLLASGMPRPS